MLRSGTRIFPHEAVAIALSLCSQMSRLRPTAGVMAAVSSSSVAVDASGAVTVNGGVPGEDEQSIALIGRLLLELLDHPAGMGPAVAPRLRATALQAATGGRDGFASLAHLAAALQRHGPEEGRLAGAVRAIFERWASEKTMPGELPRESAAADAGGASRPARREDDGGRTGRDDAPHRPRQAFPSSAERTRFSSAPDVPWRWFRPAARAVAVGVSLLVLAGAAALWLSARQPTLPLPLPPPATAPAPVSPSRHHGWELLDRPSRVSTMRRDARADGPGPVSGGGRRPVVGPGSTEDARPGSAETRGTGDAAGR